MEILFLHQEAIVKFEACIHTIAWPFTCTFRCTFLFLLSSYLHPLSQPYASFQGCFVQGPTWILARYQTGHVINQHKIPPLFCDWTTNQKADWQHSVNQCTVFPYIVPGDTFRWGNYYVMILTIFRKKRGKLSKGDVIEGNIMIMKYSRHFCKKPP